jgi:hypothetical protein
MIDRLLIRFAVTNFQYSLHSTFRAVFF